MLYFSVSFIGVLIALMIAFNGALGGYISLFEVSFTVHAIGLGILLLAIFAKGEKLSLKGIPKVFYLTGVIGACLTAIDAFTVGQLGVTLAVAMSTVAQILGSVAIDTWGVGQIKAVPFNMKRVASLGMLLIGVGIMILAP